MSMSISYELSLIVCNGNLIGNMYNDGNSYNLFKCHDDLPKTRLHKSKKALSSMNGTRRGSNEQ